MTASKFFSDGPNLHPTYAFYLNERNTFVRDRIEGMWVRYESLCPDPHFLAEARTNFIERTWEMYLACVLMDHGFPLIPTSSTGPDICIDSTPRIWVEATAVNSGQGIDRVPDRDARRFTEAERGYSDAEISVSWHGRPPSEESIILRCTSALDSKSRAHDRYLAQGIVGKDDSYVVALSLAGIQDAFYLCDYENVPVILQALFGIGEERIVPAGLDGGKAKLIRGRRPVVEKVNHAEVPAIGFSSPANPRISGVFGTCMDVVNSHEGREIMFVNNPNARVPVATRTFNFGMEFVAVNGEINRQDHRTPLTFEDFASSR
jgi:hypothetical protein